MSTTTGRLNWPFAAIWAALTFTAWLAAASWMTADTEVGSYLPAGILAQIVTIGLRWRLINGDRPTHATSHPTSQKVSIGWFELAAADDHQLTWLLCWTAQLHIFGIAMLGPSLAAAASLAMSMLLCEILLLRFAPGSWSKSLPNWWPEVLTPKDHEPSLLPMEAALESWLGKRSHPLDADIESEHELESEHGAELDSADESEFESEKLSATFHGQTEDGQSYLQGWQRYAMAAGQKSSSMTIGFFPPFMTPPECELDHEGDEEVRYEIENITPAGVRIALKRRHAEELIEGKLLWHSQG